MTSVRLEAMLNSEFKSEAYFADAATCLLYLFSNARLLAPLEMPPTVSALREIQLCGTQLKAQWLHDIAPFLSGLTELLLTGCGLELWGAKLYRQSAH